MARRGFEEGEEHNPGEESIQQERSASASSGEARFPEPDEHGPGAEAPRD